MRRIVLAAFAVTVLAACQPPTTELTEEQRTAIADTVRQLAVSFSDAWNTLDPDTHLSFYSDDVMYGFGGRFRDAESFREATTSFMNLFAEFDQSWDSLFVQVLGPTVAVTGGTVQWTNVRKSGESSLGGEAMTLVWHRVDGEWKVVHIHSSQDE